MSTLSATDADVRGMGTGARTPFARLVRVELRKLYDTRAGFWLLAAIVGSTAATMLIGMFTMDAGDRTLNNLLALAGIPQGFLLPVLGIMAVTSEWGQRTGLVTFTLEPRRGRVLVGKIVATAAIALVALAIVIGLGGLLYAIAGTGGWTLGPGEALDLVVGQLLGIAQGLAFGMLFLNTALAIVAYFALPIVWSIALSIAGSRLESVQRWLDLSTAFQPLNDHTMGAIEWAHLAVANGVWVLIPMGIGAWRVLRTEVKSA